MPTKPSQRARGLKLPMNRTYRRALYYKLEQEEVMPGDLWLPTGIDPNMPEKFPDNGAVVRAQFAPRVHWHKKAHHVCGHGDYWRARKVINSPRPAITS